MAVAGGLDGVPRPAANVHVHARAGGRRPVDPASEVATAAALAATEALNAAHAAAGGNRRAFLGIEGGTQQVVAGVKYDLSMRVAVLACPAAAGSEGEGDASSCPPLDGEGGPVTEVVGASVWARPWLAEPAARFQVTLGEGAPGAGAGAGADGGDRAPPPLPPLEG